GLDEAEQIQILLELVRTQVAIVLGHDDATAIDADRNFQELGFDSITALEMRNYLNRVIGMQLSPMAIFDQENVTSFVKYLRSELDVEHSSSDVVYPPDTLGELFRAALRSGKMEVGSDLLRAAARLRETFESSEVVGGPRPVMLCDGSTEPQIVFVCTPVFGGVYEHAHLSKIFSGRRRVWSVPLSGFKPGELLPASDDVAIESLAKAVVAAVGDTSFILVGHSSAGHLAYATAEWLTSAGVPGMEGVVLLDTFEMDVSKNLPMDQIANRPLSEEFKGGLSFESLTATITWVDFLSKLSYASDDYDALFVQCRKPVFELEVDGINEGIIANPWSDAQKLSVIDADHFSMVSSDASKVVDAIEEWLGRSRG
ncbi:alpha/beta fold hydrolase, partial [Nocardia amikacinitolerans]|uniref:alpha/beta fold hydrolase n=1 Tax=Nocardia amikacinitolerans TaxID=756689 RepID=UPI003676717C